MLVNLFADAYSMGGLGATYPLQYGSEGLGNLEWIGRYNDGRNCLQ